MERGARSERQPQARQAMQEREDRSKHCKRRRTRSTKKNKNRQERDIRSSETASPGIRVGASRRRCAPPPRRFELGALRKRECREPLRVRACGFSPGFPALSLQSLGRRCRPKNKKRTQAKENEEEEERRKRSQRPPNMRPNLLRKVAQRASEMVPGGLKWSQNGSRRPLEGVLAALGALLAALGALLAALGALLAPLLAALGPPLGGPCGSLGDRLNTEFPC